MGKTQATKLEVLLAVAMSGYYQTTHVKFLPIGKEYINTLRILKSQKYILPIGKNFFKLSKRGIDYVTTKDIVGVSAVDKSIDKFIDSI